jgi:hypothetical protein
MTWRALVGCALAALVLVPGAQAAEPTPTPSPSAALTPDPSLEAQKLELDVEKLEQDTSTIGQLRPWAGLAGVVATLIVAGFGAWRYFDDRKRDRRLRIEDGVRDGLKELNEAPESGASASARATAALIHLGGLTSQKDADSARAAEVTDAVATLVTRDLHALDTPPRAHLPALCLRDWSPYAEWLKARPGTCRELLARYRSALKRIRDDNPAYVANVRWTAGAGYVADAGTIVEADRLLFVALVVGYAAHVAQLDGDARAEELTAFGAVVNADLQSVMDSGELVGS